MTTHKLISIILLALMATQVLAQITISGRVTDKAGEPLLGVNVYLIGTYDGATTDIDGRFSFETHEKDSLKLAATFIGFHRKEIPIPYQDQQLSIELREEVSQLNAVVIPLIST